MNAVAPPVAFDALVSGIAFLGTGQQEFARSMIRQRANGRNLSTKQWDWVYKLVDTIERNKVPAKAVEIGNFAGIKAMIDKAGSRLRAPKITLQTSTGLPVVIKLMSLGRFPGSLAVTDGGPYGNNVWYGRIHKDGRWEQPKREHDGLSEVGTLLRDFAADPLKVATAYGKLTGKCCFCARPLKDKRSVEVGFGPVCAENFSLEWGA